MKAIVAILLAIPPTAHIKSAIGTGTVFRIPVIEAITVPFPIPDFPQIKAVIKHPKLILVDVN